MPQAASSGHLYLADVTGKMDRRQLHGHQERRGPSGVAGGQRVRGMLIGMQRVAAARGSISSVGPQGAVAVDHGLRVCWGARWPRERGRAQENTHPASTLRFLLYTLYSYYCISKLYLCLSYIFLFICIYFRLCANYCNQTRPHLSLTIFPEFKHELLVYIHISFPQLNLFITVKWFRDSFFFLIFLKFVHNLKWVQEFVQ